MRIGVIVMFLFLMTFSFIIRGSDKGSVLYKLVAIDSTTLSDNYICLFKKEQTIFKVLSLKSHHDKEGCWSFLQIGGEYALIMEVQPGYFTGQVNIPLHGQGFAVDGKEILKAGENFYSVTSINGLMIKQR